jgi:hypothetical protein
MNFHELPNFGTAVSYQESFELNQNKKLVVHDLIHNPNPIIDNDFFVLFFLYDFILEEDCGEKSKHLTNINFVPCLCQ